MISFNDIKRNVNMALIGAALAISNKFDSYADVYDISWIEEGNAEGTEGMFDSLILKCKEIISSAWGLIGLVGVTFAMLCLVGIGFSFMRGGRHTEQAKDDALNWLKGAFFIFGAVGIVGLVADAIQKAF